MNNMIIKEIFVIDHNHRTTGIPENLLAIRLATESSFPIIYCDADNLLTFSIQTVIFIPDNNNKEFIKKLLSSDHQKEVFDLLIREKRIIIQKTEED